MDQHNILMMFPDMDSEELYSIQNMMQGMNEQQQLQFVSIYKGKRKDRTLMLVLALVGLFGAAGIHRLITGDIGMGVLYFFTAGLCFIGTIVDLVNIGNFTLKHNLAQAGEAANLVRMMNQPPQSYNVH